MMISRLDLDVSNWAQSYKSSTSKGNQVKYTNGEIWVKENQFGYEDYAEVVTSELLKHSTLDSSEFVEYHLCNISNQGSIKEGCFSYNFLGGRDTLITLGHLLNQHGISTHEIIGGDSLDLNLERLVIYVQGLTGMNITDYLRKAFTLDAIILNEDRHLHNLAIIHNEVSGYRPAPIFDNGLSLLSDTNAYPLEQDLMKNIQRVPCRPFHKSFRETYKAIDGPAFQLDKEGVLNLIETNKLGRISSVLIYAMQEYPEVFV